MNYEDLFKSELGSDSEEQLDKAFSPTARLRKPKAAKPKAAKPFRWVVRGPKADGPFTPSSSKWRGPRVKKGELGSDSEEQLAKAAKPYGHTAYTKRTKTGKTVQVAARGSKPEKALSAGAIRLAQLRYIVSGAIARGEGQAIVGIPAGGGRIGTTRSGKGIYGPSYAHVIHVADQQLAGDEHEEAGMALADNHVSRYEQAPGGYDLRDHEDAAKLHIQHANQANADHWTSDDDDYHYSTVESAHRQLAAAHLRADGSDVANLRGMYEQRMNDPKEKKRGISDAEAMLEARVGFSKGDLVVTHKDSDSESDSEKCGPDGKPTLKKAGTILGGSLHVQYVQGDDEEIAKAISEGSLGQAAIVRPPIDKYTRR